MMQPGQLAVATKYGAHVWDFIEDEPLRVRDDVLVYDRMAPDKEAMAEKAAQEARERVRRALRDKTYAETWARRVVASGALNDPWHRLSLSEKLNRAAEQDYKDAYVTFRRVLEDGRFELLSPPSRSLRPDEHRAFVQVQKEWLASLEGAET